MTVVCFRCYSESIEANFKLTIDKSDKSSDTAADGRSCPLTFQHFFFCFHINHIPFFFSSSLVGIRVLHPVLGESGIPAQHCQKVHRPEVCPTGESVCSKCLQFIRLTRFFLHIFFPLCVSFASTFFSYSLPLGL